MDHVWIFVLLGILVTCYRVYKARIKGAIGESTIAYRLASLPKSKYHVINNLVLRNGDKTSQIDHLVVSDFGLFVVETKNLKGWIFGYENSEYWTQVIYKRKESFYNPIRQNRAHLMALRKTLHLFPGIKIIPIVVFSSSSTLKVETTSEVIYSDQLVRTIKAYTETTLSNIEKIRIYDTLSSANISHNFNRKAHIRSIKRRIDERESLIDRSICPNCKGSLVVRNGDYGRFLGCSNFPQCRFTVNI